jgi:extracellular factor (EF) 3-hydroxypalmitic acid methyl ester biosynthesis protein
MPWNPWLSEDRAALLAHGCVLHFAAGNTLIAQGHVSDALYFMLKGTARVDLMKGDTAATVATLEPGDLFGEVSFLQGETTTATVTAVSDIEVLALDKPALDHLLQDSPAFAARFFQHLAVVLSARLRDTMAAAPAQSAESAAAKTRWCEWPTLGP